MTMKETVLNQLKRKNSLLALAGLPVVSILGAIQPISIALGSGTYTTTQTTISDVRNAANGVASGGYRLTIEGSGVADSSTYENFGVIDLNAASLGILPGQQVTNVNDLNLNLTDIAEYFAKPGPVNFYLTTQTASLKTLNGASSSAAYQPGAANGGIGTQFGSLYSTGNPSGTLYSVGQLNYGSNSGGTPTYGTQYNETYSLAGLPTAAQTYLVNQVNNFGAIRILATPGGTTTSADFAGSSNGSYSTSVGLTVTTTAAPASDAQLAVTYPSSAPSGVSFDSATNTVTFSRIVTNAPIATNITVSSSSATDKSGVYIVRGQPAGTAISGGTTPTSAAGYAPAGEFGTLANGANAPIAVGMNTGSAFVAGSVGGTGEPAYATAVDQVINQSNVNQSPININIQANQVVANRKIQNADGSTGVDFGNMLIGSSVAQSVGLTTTNTLSTGFGGVTDFTPNSLTTVTLAGNTTIAAPTNGRTNLSSVKYGDTSYITMAADPNGTSTTFNGTQTENRTVTYVVPTSEPFGGSYNEAGYYIGYSSFALTQNDTALGAAQNPTGQVYVIGDVYQAAQLQDAQSTANNGTQSSPATTFYAGLQNAAPTANSYGNVTSTSNGGLRASADITGSAPTIDAANTQYAADWTLATGANSIVPGTTVIAPGSSVQAANFTPGSTLLPTLLNGQYQVQLDGITAQNDANPNAAGAVDTTPIAGVAANDLGTHSYILTATVTGNLGYAGTANSAAILAGESYNGYNIQRANETGSQQTNVQFLGGTASVATTLSVNFANAPTANTSVVSDVANITGTGSDTHVVQMSYSPGSISNGSNSPTLAWSNGSIYQAANFGNTGGTPTEYTGAYNPATAGENALGSYGINTANNTVWAVVNNGAGNFAVMQRTPGDTTGKGSVTLADLSTVYNNVGISSGATWSQGDFVGTGNVSLGDLSTVYNNVGVSQVAAISASTSKAPPLMSVPAASVAPPAVTDVSLTVNTTTGAATLVFHNPIAQFYAWEITSTTGGLSYANLTDITNYGTGLHARGPGALDGVYSAFATGGYYNPGGTWNLGDIINPADITSNSLDFSFNEFNAATGYSVNFDPATINYTAVPEPTPLALFAMGGLALLALGRKRRNA